MEKLCVISVNYPFIPSDAYFQIRRASHVVGASLLTL